MNQPTECTPAAIYPCVPSARTWVYPLHTNPSIPTLTKDIRRRLVGIWAVQSSFIVFETYS